MNPRKMSCQPDCPDRTAECHTKCKRYALRLAAQEIANEKRKFEDEINNYFCNVAKKALTKKLHADRHRIRRKGGGD